MNIVPCVFVGEGVPHFPPTYRLKKGTHDSYDHIKVKRAGVGCFHFYQTVILFE